MDDLKIMAWYELQYLILIPNNSLLRIIKSTQTQKKIEHENQKSTQQNQKSKTSKSKISH
jgi:hypothetical protein